MNQFFAMLDLSPQHVLAVGGRILLSLIILFIALRITNRLFRRAHRRIEAAGREVRHLRYLRYVVRGIIYFTCIGSVLNQIPGLDSMFTSLLAGSGILAVVVGIASQEAVGNIVSGALILLFKPFKVGDLVRYVSMDTTGTVEEIGLRHTTIRTFENKRLLIPNSLMNSNIVENASYEEASVSICLDIAITYESDTALAMSAMAEAIAAHPAFSDRRTPEEREQGASPVIVRIRDFADSAIILRSWVWAESSGAGVQLKSDLLLAIKEAFAENGIAFAYPTLTLNSPGSLPEDS